MFCQKCGKKIENDAVVCIHCGAETKNFAKNTEKSINIVNNQATSTKVQGCRSPRVYNGGIDFLMILLTSGLWIIWMIFRPKYY